MTPLLDIRLPWSTILIALICTCCGCGRVELSAVRDVTYPTVTVVRSPGAAPYKVPVLLYGRLQPRRITVLSCEMTGRVQRLVVDEGDIADEGQVLATLNTDVLESERRWLLARGSVEQALFARLKKGERTEVVQAARAEAARMAAEAEQARLHFERVQKLRQTNTSTEADLEAAKFGQQSRQDAHEVARQRLLELESGSRPEDLEAQQHRITSIQAELELLDAKIQKSVVRAPFAAHVVRRFVDEGAIIPVGEPILELHEAGMYEVRIASPLQYLDSMRSVSAIEVGTRTFPVTGHHVVSMVDPVTRTVDLIYDVQVDGSEPVISGQTCRVSAQVPGNTEAIELPLRSLTPSVRGLWSCFCLVPTKKADHPQLFEVTKIDVTSIHTDGQRALVFGDLPPGSRVVAEGAHKVVPGMWVRALEEVP